MAIALLPCSSLAHAPNKQGHLEDHHTNRLTHVSKPLNLSPDQTRRLKAVYEEQRKNAKPFV